MSAFYRIDPAAVALAAPSDKPAVFAELGRLYASAYGLSADAVVEGLEEREQLGSTGFGRGVALPHARSAAVQRPLAAMLKLAEPIDFAAADGMPVDIVVGLVSPVDAGATHLHALAALSRALRDEAVHDALADARDAAMLHAVMSESSAKDAA